MGERPLLRMENISKTFVGVKALDGVRLDIRRGEVHALIGENGAGKSTLIKILAGVEKPDPGFIFEFDGAPAEIRNPVDAGRKGISVIYQDLSLFPNLTVAENITIGRDESRPFGKVKWRDIRAVAERAVRELGVDLPLDVPVEQLSVAKQQLVAIARALAFQSKIIVMDEPTSSLSGAEVEHLYRVIRKLKSDGIAILFVSHKLKELFAVADRFTVLRDGRYIGTYDSHELTEEQLITLMVGRPMQRVHYERRAAGETVLDVRGLSKRGYFKDITFSLRAGEIVGMTGLVGSGRTELAHALFGLLRPDRGTVHLMGRRVAFRSPEQAVAAGIAYVPESRQQQGLILRQSIIDNVSLPGLKRLRNRFGLIVRSKEVALARQFIERLDIRPPIPTMATGQLSGGNQQKVVVAKWLSIRPRVLIVDEPTNGVDVGAKAEIHRLLRGFAEEGLAVLMISSDLPEVLNVSDRILVMRRGRIVVELPSEGTTQEDVMRFAVLGGDELREPVRGEVRL